MPACDLDRKAGRRLKPPGQRRPRLRRWWRRRPFRRSALGRPRGGDNLQQLRQVQQLPLHQHPVGEALMAQQARAAGCFVNARPGVPAASEAGKPAAQRANAVAGQAFGGCPLEQSGPLLLASLQPLGQVALARLERCEALACRRPPAARACASAVPAVRPARPTNCSVARPARHPTFGPCFWFRLG